MKKTLLFTIILAFLAVGVWGQQEFTWNGATGGNWNIPGNWSPSFDPTSYPGDPDRPGSEGDTAILRGGSATNAPAANADTHRIVLTGLNISIKEVVVNPTQRIQLIGGSIKAETTTLNGVLHLDGTPWTGATNLAVESYTTHNLTIAPRVTVGGAYYPGFDGTLIMGRDGGATVVMDRGTGGGAATGSLTVTVAAGGYAEIGDITSGGTRNVIVNAGDGSTVIIGDIVSNPPHTTPGDGTVVVITDSGSEFIWTGNSGSDWDTLDNWSRDSAVPTIIPGSDSGHIVSIPSGLANNPVLNTAIAILVSLTNEGTLTLGSHNLTALTITNTGELQLEGNAGQLAGGTHTTMGGTVVFTGAGTTLAGITDFNNLTIEDGTRTAVNDITAESVTIEGGTLTVNAQLETGEFTLEGGTLNLNDTLIVTDTFTQSGGTIELGAGGTLICDGTAEQTGGVITGDELILGGSGSFDLTSAGNKVGKLEITGAGGDVSFINDDNLEIVEISGVGNNDVTIETTGGGNITQSGAIITEGNLTLKAAGDITQSKAITTEGNLTLEAAGEITQSEAITIDGTLTLKAGGKITLEDSDNEVGKLEITGAGGDVSFINNGDLDIVELSGVGSSDVTIETTNNGNITQSEEITIEGNLTLKAAGDITQSKAITTEGNLTLEAAGEITQSEAITIYGTLTLEAAGAITLEEDNEVGKLEITGAGGVVSFINNGNLDIVEISGVDDNDVTIETTGGGDITQSGAIETTGTLTLEAAGAVTLENSGNEVSKLEITGAGGDVKFTNNGDLEIVKISGVDDNDVKIETTNDGNITQSGEITTEGNLTLKADGDITQSKAITTEGNLTLEAAGEITQSEAITIDGILNLKAGGKITLEKDNKVGKLEITGAGGVVSFINDGDLEIVEISGAGSNNVTIEITSGDITQSGAITTEGNLTLEAAGEITQSGVITTEGNLTLEAAGEITQSGAIETTGTLTLDAGGSITITGTIGSAANPNGVVILTSGDDQDIIINADIAALSLALIAGPSNNSTGTVEIAAPITVSGSDENHDENDAVYINAGTLKGSGNIKLGASGWVCAWIFSNIEYEGVVTDNRIHYHTLSNKHLVYGIIPPADPLPDIPSVNEGEAIAAGSYIYVQSNLDLGGAITFSTTGNVYIIDVGSNTNSNNRSVTFEAGGYIEIRGEYTSSGFLTLRTSQNIRLNDKQDNSSPAVLTLPEFIVPTPLLLMGGTSAPAVIKAPNISLALVSGTTDGGNNLHLDTSGADTNTLLIDGAAGSSALRLGEITVSADGEVTFNEKVYAASYTQTGTGTTTFSEAQNYSGVNADDFGFSFTGAALTLEDDATLTTESGGVVINNSGLFMQNAGADISSRGTFSQTGSGASILAANITTTGTAPADSSIVFNGALQLNLSGTITLDSSSGGGDILFNYDTTVPAIDAAGNGNNHLTLAAGEGNIAVAGQVGVSETRLGNINISSANDIVFGGDINSNDLTIVSANDIAFNANVSARDIEITSSGTISFQQIDGRDIDINNGGLYTQNGNVNASVAFAQTGSGDVLLGGSITANLGGNAASPDIGFTSGITLTLANNVTFTVPDAISAIALPAIVDGGQSLTLKGGSSSSAPLLLTRHGGTDIIINNDVTITADSYAVLNIGASITQGDTGTLALALTLEQGDTVLDTSEGSWHLGNGGTALNDFAGINGTFILKAGSKLICDNLNLTGASFDLDNSDDDRVYISAKGNVAISSDVNLVSVYLPQLVLEMTGDGPDNSQIQQSLNSAQPLGSLHVKPGSRTNLQNNLDILGEVEIEYATAWPNPPSQAHGVLNAGSYNITIHSGLSETKYGAAAQVGRWKIINAPQDITDGADIVMRAFMQEPSGSVEFKKRLPSDNNVYFEIFGNTIWQKFICREGGSTIQFSMHPNHHVFLASFEITGETNNHITLTRYVEPDSPWMHIYDGSRDPPSVSDGPENYFGLPMVPSSRSLKDEAEQEKEKFWNFNIVPSRSDHKAIDIQHVTVFFSHAWYQRIPIASEAMDLNAIPFYRESDKTGHFNVDWVEVRKIIYSFVEDSNGNGKLDRIRVQTNVQLNGEFDRFMVEVEGYKVTGFDVVYHNIESPEPEDMASFFIYIEEVQHLYDGQPVKWYVTQNDDSLKDNLTQTYLVGDPESDEVYTTINTIPPRISYALTVPGHNELFFQMSQPVSSYMSGGTISGDRITAHDHNESALTRTAVPPYFLEYYTFENDPIVYYLDGGYDYIPVDGVVDYKVTLNNAPSVSDLAALPAIGVNDLTSNYFELLNLRDTSVRALDWNDELIDTFSYMYYPSPRYPVDWNYSGYKTYVGNSHVAGLTADDSSNPDPVLDIFLPPNRVLTPEMTRRLEQYASGTPGIAKVTPQDFITTPAAANRRRITDVLISRRPSDNDSENYFAWPSWARDVSALYRMPDDTDFAPPVNIDNSTGIIWEFDGTQYLEAPDTSLPDDNRSYEIQVRVNRSLLSTELYPDVNLFYGINVPIIYRNTPEAPVRGKISGGLWLPNMTDPAPLYNILSGPTNKESSGFMEFYNAHRRTSANADPLFTFAIPWNESNFSSGSKFEFLLRFENNSNPNPNLYMAWLDAPQEILPDNWWNLIRPFSFDIQDMRRQRGGVTVLNNVINSETREAAYIRYHLARPGRVTIQIYTLDGTLVKSLLRNETRSAGEWTEGWDGSNNGGRPVARGMYFVRVVGPDIDEIRKIMVVR